MTSHQAELEPQLQLQLELATELQSSGRCSFAAQQRFQQLQRTLAKEAAAAASPRERDIRRLAPNYRPPRDAERYPCFATKAGRGAVAARLELAMQAATQNAAATRTPYRAPSAHEFRDSTPLSPQRRDFQAKFALPSNQDLRRSTARDQDGFFGAAPGEDVLLLPLSPPFQRQLQHQRSRTARPASPERPAFASRVAHTARKSSNVALRLEQIRDEEGLLPQLQDVRKHLYRAQTTASVPFVAGVRPASPLQPMSP